MSAETSNLSHRHGFQIRSILTSRQYSRKLLLILVLLTFTILLTIVSSNAFIFHTKIFTTDRTFRIDKFSSTLFYPHIAVLVEFRSTSIMVTVVHNIIYHIPTTWPIQIFHGETNRDFIIKSTLAPLMTSGKIILTVMEVYNRSRTNELLTEPKFWQRVRGEKILLFQIDSIMCSNSRHKITEYLAYDYVGAPWDPSWFPYNKENLVGNGGFSLRSRSKMLALLALIRYDPLVPEDVWYAQNLHRVNASVAPVSVAKTFAVESVYYERPLGVHRFPLKCSLRSQVTAMCPEATLIMTDKCH